MCEDSTISCYDNHSEAYDAYQFAVVPGYREMLYLVARACKRYIRPNPRIVDLGCGTGNASMSILEALPASKIFLIDGSKKMVYAAKRKICKVAPESIIGYKVADFFSQCWDLDVGSEEHDAVVSTLVLEHLPFDIYKSVIDKCFRLLKPGGCLIVAEGYEEKGSDMLRWFNEEMEERRIKLDLNVSEFVSRLREQREVHYYCNKEQKAAWWREVGFQEVNIIWQYLCIALMMGRKPP